jgi:starvation-inducible DNA-binding protein
MATHSRGESAGHRENLPPRRASRADIPVALTTLLTDMFALYLKTKKFHGHVLGPHSRDYRLLLDQAAQIFDTADIIAERVHKLGSPTIKSIRHSSRPQRVNDNDADEVAGRDMLSELLEDNRLLAEEMLKTHKLCDESGDAASAGLIETWIDEARGRARFLRETVQPSSRLAGSELLTPKAPAVIPRDFTGTTARSFQNW